MSWSTSITFNHENTGIGLQKDLDAINTLVPSGQDYAKVERDEQCEAAKRAAFQIISEGGFGNAEEITVSLSGHANEGHEDTKGANESINVSVFVKKYRATE